MKFRYIQLKTLPREGSCIVNSEQGLQLQSLLNKRWAFEEEDPRYAIWDPTTCPDSESFMFSDNNHNRHKRIYVLIWSRAIYYSWSTGTVTAQHERSNLVNFSDYFKEDEKYIGYFTGKSYNI